MLPFLFAKSQKVLYNVFMKITIQKSSIFLKKNKKNILEYAGAIVRSKRDILMQELRSVRSLG